MKNNDKFRNTKPTNSDSPKIPRWKRLSPVEITERGPVNRHEPSAGERLQKILAQAGIASRRAAEEMIAAGRVSINGEVVREMGLRADPTLDTIAVDGKPINPASSAGQGQKFVYIAMNKPLGVVSTVKDPEGRATVLSLLAGAKLTEQGLRLYPVGRLDTDSTGLLLLTNDGDLTFRLTHPRYGVEKEYLVTVRGRPNAEAIRRLREGVSIEGEMTAPAKVDMLRHTEGNTTLRITIHEGRKHQVRLMTAEVGHPVIELTRVRFGPIELGDLQPGKWRNLATHEAHALRKSVKLKSAHQNQVASLAQPTTPAQPQARSRPTRRVQTANPTRPHNAGAAHAQRRPPAPSGARQSTARPGRTLAHDEQRRPTNAPGSEQGRGQGRGRGYRQGQGQGATQPRRPDRAGPPGTSSPSRSPRGRSLSQPRPSAPRQSATGRDDRPSAPRQRGSSTGTRSTGSTGAPRTTRGPGGTNRPRSTPQRGRPGSPAPRNTRPNRRRDR